ncbi:MAG: 2-C-methyl-D-erythritol 4-phosphate cytidylyltransferase [Deltaproteobacteria bacterium]|nr:2-C-methyl-D-erythritol 4-phosphate cytidylyltransferase [Deltaproteobacteria bacterium]MBW2305721.1 2-C-methyl-D-erythritol 4-phosphate cytidylyltransferase [Deltaproteobacteria bacterium]
MQTCAIVPAAGMGLRMGGNMSKTFIALDGVPILARTLLRLQAVKEIDALVPVVQADYVRHCLLHIVEAYGIQKAIRVVEGGKTRQESVLRGLEAADMCRMIIVHDAVRPFVTEDLIRKVLDAAANSGAAMAALPAVDTVKKVSENRLVLETLDRQQIWMAQTPQAFRWELLMNAHKKAAREGWMTTDDASLVERLGVPVQVVEGLRNNIKITTPEDLLMAARILEQQSDHTYHARSGHTYKGEPSIHQASGRTHAATLRVGFGYDVHRLERESQLWLGGVCIPYEKGLQGHSDADVLLHALCDAILGSMALGDLGTHFPDTDQQYGNIRSTELLRRVCRLLREKGAQVENVDATVVAQAPRLAPYITSMVEIIASILGIEKERVSVKAKTTEGLGFAGRGEGMEAYSIVLVGQEAPHEVPGEES